MQSHTYLSHVFEIAKRGKRSDAASRLLTRHLQQ
jgi:hypothetical protein